MTLPCPRPPVQDLMFRVFHRGLHPELFEGFERLELKQPGFRAQLHLCRTGHWLSFVAGKQIVSEAISEREQLLPTQKRTLDHRIRGCRTHDLQFDDGLRYSVSFQLETLSPDVFLQYQEELRGDFAQGSVWHLLPSPHRLTPPAISLLRAETTANSLLVHAFHTFPENCSVVKTQSIYELT